jgi:hypothetical protein
MVERIDERIAYVLTHDELEFIQSFDAEIQRVQTQVEGLLNSKRSALLLIAKQQGLDGEYNYKDGRMEPTEPTEPQAEEPT